MWLLFLWQLADISVGAASTEVQGTQIPMPLRGGTAGVRSARPFVGAGAPSPALASGLAWQGLCEGPAPGEDPGQRVGEALCVPASLTVWGECRGQGVCAGGDLHRTLLIHVVGCWTLERLLSVASAGQVCPVACLGRLALPATLAGGLAHLVPFMDGVGWLG